MKANAPEKLYLRDTGILGDGISTGRFRDTDIEYILTDAFIEKAEKAMIEWAGTYISKTTGGGARERKVLATDLLNYFKKYMKGR